MDSNKQVIPKNTYASLTFIYTVFCISATVVSLLETARLAFIYHRHVQQIKAELDGLPRSTSLTSQLLLEQILLLAVLLDDLPITGIVLAAQLSVGCQSLIYVTNHAVNVVTIGSCVNACWKFCLHFFTSSSYCRSKQGVCCCVTSNVRSHRKAVMTTFVIGIRMFVFIAIILCLVLVSLNFVLSNPKWMDSVLSHDLLNGLFFKKIGFDNWLDEDYVRIIIKSVFLCNTTASSNVGNSESVKESYIDIVKWRNVLTMPPNSSQSILLPLNENPHLGTFLYRSIVMHQNLTNQRNANYTSSNAKNENNSRCNYDSKQNISYCNNDKIVGKAFNSSDQPPSKSAGYNINLDDTSDYYNTSALDFIQNDFRLYLRLTFLSHDVIAYSFQYRVTLKAPTDNNDSTSIENQCVSGTLPGHLIDGSSREQSTAASEVTVDGRGSNLWSARAPRKITTPSKFYSTNPYEDLKSRLNVDNRGVSSEETNARLANGNVTMEERVGVVYRLSIGYSPLKPNRWVRCEYRFVYNVDDAVALCDENGTARPSSNITF